MARLSLVLSSGQITLTGPVTVVGAGRAHDLSELPKDITTIVQPMFPEHQHLKAQGFTVATGWPEMAQTTCLFLPRSKTLALHQIAKAAQTTQGTLIIDGQKTDGIESVLKAVKKLVPVAGQISKAHGKLFWVTTPAPLAALAPPPLDDVAGFTVAPGVFSADGIDPGSAALIQTLPDTLRGTIADFGAGWGLLSAHVLKMPAVETLHLVEADHTALTCAQTNITDPRAQFHWEDATTWRAPKLLDCVVMNPPFHTGRAATPELGQAFIRNAARRLTRTGTLWLVANRHLPYEQVLEACFMRIDAPELVGGFKVIRASHPRQHSARGA